MAFRPTPFSRVLIANRGEAALRVMRSARALGYSTVAVYSNADAHALHVQEADLSVCIGDALPSASYLNIEAILHTAQQTAADAIHPGYGFLAESSAFARACRQAKLQFIGPSPDVIELMGNKARAKRFMEDAGVPCIPGYSGLGQSDEVLDEEAHRIGFPLMIKACGGGGGRGMRLVHDSNEFFPALRSARAEALNAFGDARVLLERALVSPRHIEVQIAGDRYGHTIHFGERDCSVQRRHQKLIEESPSPVVNAELRERLGEVCVKAATAAGYEGVGTFEFLLDEAGGFWFMEMNTRLQVEHAVTEAITGVDLVELQLRIAAGEPLSLAQSDVRFEGHSIEVRLCAEDPMQAFAPRAGAISMWQAPEHVRVESALQRGAHVSSDYDSLVAKFVSHGGTREEARRKLCAAVENSTLLGLTTNQTFLAECLRHPVFAQGQATTAFVGMYADDIVRACVPTSIVQAVAVVLLHALPSRNQVCDPHAPLGRLMHARSQVRLCLDGRRISGELMVQDGRHADVFLDGSKHELEVIELGPDSGLVACDNVGSRFVYVAGEDGVWLRFRGQSVHIQAEGIGMTSSSAVKRSGSGAILAEMEGRVVRIFRRVGDRVHAGDTIASVEAMKMEHVYSATIDGEVSELPLQEGQIVRNGQLIANIEAEASNEFA